MKKKLIALALAASLLGVFAAPVQAHPASATTHGNCEGLYGFDHGLKYDGAGWYHTMQRIWYRPWPVSVTKTHYFQSGGILQYQHRTIYSC